MKPNLDTICSTWEMAIEIKRLTLELQFENQRRGSGTCSLRLLEIYAGKEGIAAEAVLGPT